MNFCSLILYIAITYPWEIFIDILIPISSTSTTNTEILVSAFQEKVSSTSFYFANIHSNVRQCPELLGANQPFSGHFESEKFCDIYRTEKESNELDHTYRTKVRTRTRITHEKFRTNGNPKLPAGGHLKKKNLVVSEIWHNS